ncbi:histidine kinase dimerization/phospho-acceptor domain-containing protein, partial [Pseudomonas sp. SIMBA_044]|uniref:histidine kinase dimerization/phospho-acceptor domain-containing protein n=1 Tax=Pseudomonas sp. SIMBA_044 TaxID=3085785 RepID=UPI00397E64F0
SADEASQAKTLFLATMSHEIRTPLYGVLGNLELLEMTPLNERQQGYLHTIQRSSAVLFQLISDVLDVSKIESGQMSLQLNA